MIKNIARFMRFLALGGWIGAILYFAAIVTQGAFSVLSRDEAGAMVGYTLRGLHWMGVIAAVIFLVATIALDRSLRALVRPAAVSVILMLLLTLASQRVVIPRMDSLRAQMVSVDATPASNPLRAKFDQLHGISVDLESAVLLIGFVSLYLTAKEKHG